MPLYSGNFRSHAYVAIPENKEIVIVVLYLSIFDAIFPIFGLSWYLIYYYSVHIIFPHILIIINE